jgi:multidrug efflux pump subunit AcrA (membrane-fusion protein)
MKPISQTSSQTLSQAPSRTSAVRRRIGIAVVSIALIAVTAAAATSDYWMGPLRALVTGELNEADSDDGHAHGTDGHAAGSLKLSEAARKNIGLKVGIVEAKTFVKTVPVPAMVVERPGRSQVEITALLTGIVTRVYPNEGDTIEPGQALFDLRLTHEELVTAQRDFLRSTEELDVVRREIARLETLGDGVVAGRRIVEQQYDQQKLEAAIHAQRQGLLLHGLTDSQVDSIRQSRRLLNTLTATAPPLEEEAEHHDVEHLYQVQQIAVRRGQHVEAGNLLAVLADHCLLYVQGQAFEDDAERLMQAARENHALDVSSIVDGRSAGPAEPLHIASVADRIDAKTRALRFNLLLPNKRVETDGRERRFVGWKYRPGQRMEVHIPIGQPWKDQIVLPPEAVVDEGAEVFVFERDNDHFDRVAVHVVYRDKNAVVIQNDGTLVGSTLAMTGAYQMNMEIKKKSGAGTGADSHAGHSH